MSKLYRVRRGWWNKAVLQEWSSFPDSLPNAPMPQWVDVDFRQAPPAMVVAPPSKATEEPK